MLTFILRVAAPPWQVQADAAGCVTTSWVVDDPDAYGAGESAAEGAAHLEL